MPHERLEELLQLHTVPWNQEQAFVAAVLSQWFLLSLSNFEKKLVWGSGSDDIHLLTYSGLMIRFCGRPPCWLVHVRLYPRTPNLLWSSTLVFLYGITSLLHQDKPGINIGFLLSGTPLHPHRGTGRTYV